MPRRASLAIAILLTFCLSAVISAEPLDANRIAEIAKWLPEEPQGVGPTIQDRAAWKRVGENTRFAKAIDAAEKLRKKPTPELTDDLFLDFSHTGNRTRCQGVLSQRHRRLPTFVIAECIENKGRFLPDIEQSICDICSEKTWVLPAHDRSLANFQGKTQEVDLVVAAVSWDMATACYWLGEKLSPEIRELVRDQLDRRTIDSMESYVNTGKPRMWWATGTNNWNAVCLAGVTGTALAMEPSRERRAFFAAAAEKYIQYFKKGFTSDGYCSEGMGYWNYGFGNFVLLAETLLQATGGKLDLFTDPLIKEVALFGPRMEIIPGVYPSFADCAIGSKPDTRMMAFLSRRFQLGMTSVEAAGIGLEASSSSNLFSLALYGFDNSATAVSPAEDGIGRELRNWFPEAGILICRPDDPKSGLGAALKGGHNSEHHNHNDVGSYVVALAGKTPLLDPGGEIYTARTFSKERYVSGVLNSFGHPVPRFGETLQRRGRAAAAKVLETEFTDQADTLVLDLKAAYPIKGLKTLQRTFVFSRAGRGALTVTDKVELEQPTPFETALITFSEWQQNDNRLHVGSGDSAVDVAIDTHGTAFTLEDTEIHEKLSHGRIPFRLAVRLEAPVTSAQVTLTITPASK